MELNKDYVTVLKNRAKNPKPKGIHSYTHQIAKDVCDWFGQGYKEFGIWLGIATRKGPGQLKAKLDDIKAQYAHTGDPKYKEPKFLMGCMRAPVDNSSLINTNRLL